MPKSKHQKRVEALERQYQLESNIFNSGHIVEVSLWIFDTIRQLPVNLQGLWAEKFDKLALASRKRWE